MSDQRRGVDDKWSARSGSAPDRSVLGTPPLMGRTQIDEAFNHFADEAERRGVHVEMFVVGGGAMALAYNLDRMTGDIDGVFEPKAVAYDIAEIVAARHPQMNLEEGWLNDAVKGFLPGEDPHASVYFDRPGLSVRVASPRYLFVLKALAARETDEGDLSILYPLCGFQSSDEALDAVELAYPHVRIPPNVQYLVEQIAAEQDTSQP